MARQHTCLARFPRHETMDTQVAKSVAGGKRADHGMIAARRRLAELIQSIRRRAHEAFDALLHDRRRAAAHARLIRAMPVQSVVFLCHGNICRSSYAEFAFRRLAASNAVRMSVESAGFIGPNRQPPQHALGVALRRGIDMATHRSRLLTQPMLASAGIVVVMAAEQARAIRPLVRRDVIFVLGDLDPRPNQRRTIRDPWGESESVFEASYERIDRCLAELMGPIVARRHPTTD